MLFELKEMLEQLTKLEIQAARYGVLESPYFQMYQAIKDAKSRLRECIAHVQKQQGKAIC